MTSTNHRIISFLIMLISANLCFGFDLQQTISSAIENDPTLASAKANNSAAYENIAIARARLFPQINATGTYSEAQQKIGSSDAQGLPINRTFNKNAKNEQINLRQSIFRPRDWAGLSIAELQSQYGAQKLISAESDLWFRSINAWIDLTTAIQNLKIQQKPITSLLKAVQQAESKYKNGKGTKDAWLDAIAQLEIAQYQVRDADLTVETKKNTYEILTGLKINKETFSGNFPEINRITFPEKILDKALSLAIDVNPNLSAASLNEQIALNKLNQSKYDHIPTIDLVASSSRSSNDTINTINSEYKSNQIGIQVLIPIFTGGQLSAIDRQNADLALAAKNDYLALKNRVTSEFINKWNSYISGSQYISALEKSSFSAREKLRAAQLGLKSGAFTWSEVAAAEMQLSKQENNLIFGIQNYLKSQVELLANYPTNEPYWNNWISRFPRSK